MSKEPDNTMMLSSTQESIASNGLQFEVETREIWLLEARLHKGHAVTGLSSGQIVFGCLGSKFGLFFRLKFVAVGFVGFFFFH